MIAEQLACIRELESQVAARDEHIRQRDSYIVQSQQDLQAGQASLEQHRAVIK